MQHSGRQDKDVGLLSAYDSKIDYFNYHKPTDKRSLPRNYRSRKDPFEPVCDEVHLKLELQPEIYARE